MKVISGGESHNRLENSLSDWKDHQRGDQIVTESGKSSYDK